MKMCSRCKQIKDTNKFAKNAKKKDGRSYHCLECQAELNKRWYQKNKTRIINKVTCRRKILKEEAHNFILEYLSNHPCVDCGETDILVLEFDHLEEDKKDFTIGQVIGQGYLLSSIKNEISKCEVRCANCHRRKTAKQLGWWKINRS